MYMFSPQLASFPNPLSPVRPLQPGNVTRCNRNNSAGAQRGKFAQVVACSQLTGYFSSKSLWPDRYSWNSHGRFKYQPQCPAALLDPQWSDRFCWNINLGGEQPLR